MLQNKLDIKHSKHILYNNASCYLILRDLYIKSQQVQHPKSFLQHVVVLFCQSGAFTEKS